MKYSQRLLCLALSFIGLLQTTYAQNAEEVVKASSSDVESTLPPIHKSKYNRWYIAFGGGNSMMRGDLSNFGTEIQKFDWGGNLIVGHHFNATLGLELAFTYADYSGFPSKFGSGYLDNDTNEALSGLNSEGSAKMISLNGILNLSNLALTGDSHKRTFNFIFYPGIGYTFYNPILYKGNEVLKDYSTNKDRERSNAGSLNVPMGFGMKIRAGKSIDFELRHTVNFHFEDNVDAAVSQQSVADKLYYTSVNLIWKLGRKDRSIQWINPLDEAYVQVQDIEARVAAMEQDSDGDGVADRFDQSPDTPAGVLVGGNGAPVDIDGDGVADYRDLEPFSPRGAVTDTSGREIDSDRDGIPNSRDIEPNTEKGALVNWQGVTINGGDIAAVMIPSIYFRLNSSNVDYDSYHTLATIARFMKSVPDMRMRVTGSADSSGPEDYNQKLALKRSNKVINQLVEVYDIDRNRFEAMSQGEKQPLSSGQAYRSINRRVDFEIIQK